MVRETYKTTLLENNVSSQFLLLLIFATLKIKISIISEIYRENLLELLTTTCSKRAYLHNFFSKFLPIFPILKNISETYKTTLL